MVISNFYIFSRFEEKNWKNWIEKKIISFFLSFFFSLNHLFSKYLWAFGAPLWFFLCNLLNFLENKTILFSMFFCQLEITISLWNTLYLFLVISFISILFLKSSDTVIDTPKQQYFEKLQFFWFFVDFSSE